MSKRWVCMNLYTIDDVESDTYWTQTGFFQEQSSLCRAYLSSHLSSCTLDNLVSEVQQLSHRSGFFFALSSLCSDRLSHLPISKLLLPPTSTSKPNRFEVCKTFHRPSTLTRGGSAAAAELLHRLLLRINQKLFAHACDEIVFSKLFLGTRLQMYARINTRKSRMGGQSSDFSLKWKHSFPFSLFPSLENSSATKEHCLGSN